MSVPAKEKPRRMEVTDFTGVADFLGKEDPVDPPTTLDSAVAHEQSDAEDTTDESAAPVFTDTSTPAKSTDKPVEPLPKATTALRTLWDEPVPPRRRPIPKKAIAAAGFGVLLLVLPLLLHHKLHTAAEESAPTLPEDLVVSERDLKNRVEVTADDFHPRRPGDKELNGASEEAPALTDDEAGVTLAERRKRRAQDPEDLVGKRGKSGGADNTSSNPDVLMTGYQRPYVYFEIAAATPFVRSGVAGINAPAGTVVSAVLTSPVDLRAGSTTIVARSDSDGPIPKASRFVGSASSDGEGRVALRFDRLLLPDGREAKIQGEAQDENGSFGLEGSVSTDGSTSTSGAVARELAQSTASDVATEAVGTLTGGMGGRLLQRVIGRVASQRGLPSLATRRTTLPAGAHFQIFLHQAVAVRG